MQERHFAPSEATSEDRLIRFAKQGQSHAMRQLLNEYKPLLGLIGKLRNKIDPDHTVPFDEILSAGQMGALLALKRYRPDSAAKFITYAYNDIRGEIIRAVYPDGPSPDDEDEKLVFTSLNEENGWAAMERYEAKEFERDPDYGRGEGFDRLEKLEDLEERGRRATAVRSFVRSLPTGERTVVEGHFFAGQTHAALARERGVTRPAISKTMARALARGREELEFLAA